MDTEEQNQMPLTPTTRKKKPVIGYLLIIIGVIFLFERIFSFSLFDYIAWRYIWPVLVIFLGIHIVVKKSR